MNEEEKYQRLENDLIRLNVAKSMIKFWHRLRRKPSQELIKAVEDLHESATVASAHLEFCHVDNYDKLSTLLEKAEKTFLNTIAHYSSLNRWNYHV
jgi:hypothetical protein